MLQEALPAWPEAETIQDDYVVPYATVQKLGHGDAKAGRRILRAMINIEAGHDPINGPTPHPDHVRLANIADESSLVDLLRLDIAENAEHIAPVNEAALFSFVQAATRDIHNLGQAKPCIGVIGTSERIEAAIFLEWQRWFWSDRWFLEERLVAVRADHRASHHANNLIMFARWFVDTMSAEVGERIRLVSSVVATKDIMQKQAFFGRRLNRCGGVYSYPDPCA